MAQSYVASQATVGVSPSLGPFTVNLPGAGTSAIQAGDVMTVFVSLQSGVPSGLEDWSSLPAIFDTGPMNTRIYWKVMGGSDASPAITLGSSDKPISHVLQLRGTDTLVPWEIDAGAVQGLASTSYVTPTVDAPYATAFAFVHCAARGTTPAAAWTPDAALTTLLDSTLSASGSGVTALLAWSAAAVSAGSHSYTQVSPVSSAAATMWLGYPADPAATPDPSLASRSDQRAIAAMKARF